MKWVAGACAVLMLIGSTWARADDASLAQIAEKTKREREARRAKETKPVKSFTNDDLKNGPATDAAAEDAGRSAETPPAGGDADKKSADAAAKPEKTDEEIRAGKQQLIQKKIDAERKRMQMIDQAMAEAQTELADITNFTYGTHRADLQKVIDDGNAEKAKAQQSIEDLREEARRLGVPVS